jgi:carbamoyl-phosphate synthase large subunit
VKRKYHCLAKERYVEGDYALTTIREEDILPIRQWRNDQREVLRQKHVLTEQEQTQYFASKIWPSLAEPQPSQILMSFLQRGQCIGYGGLVHLDWEDRHAEVAFLLETSRNANLPLFREELRIFLRLLAQLALEDLALHKLTTEAYDLRPYLIEEFEKFGFRYQGRLEQHRFLQGQWRAAVQHALFKNDYQNWNKKAGHVLVTSINQKVPLLGQVREAAARWSPQSKIFGSDLNDRCVGRYFVDDFVVLPRDQDLSFDRVRAICEQWGIRAVIPTRDAELPFWARHKKEFAAAGIAVMVADAAAVETCGDKLQFYQKMAALNFPMIPAAETPDGVSAERWVVKERWGAGSLTIGLNLDREQALRHGQTLKHPLYQPFRRGDEFSVDVYVDARGRAKGAIARRRVLVVGGQSQVATSQRLEDLEGLCLKMAEALGLYGHAIFQAIRDDQGGWHFIECNSRFGGASTLSVSMGLDSFYWFLGEAGGRALDELPFVRTSTEKTQVRHAWDRVLEAEGT